MILDEKIGMNFYGLNVEYAVGILRAQPDFAETLRNEVDRQESTPRAMLRVGESRFGQTFSD